MPATPIIMPIATKSSIFPYGNGNGNTKTSALPPRPSTNNKKLTINHKPSSISNAKAKGRHDTNHIPAAVTTATATVSRSTTMKRLPDSYRSYNAPDNDLYIPNSKPGNGHGKAVLHQHQRPMSLGSFPADNNANATRSLSLSRANKAVDVNVTNGINELGYGFRSFPGGSSSGEQRWLWQKSLSEGNLADKETPLFLDQNDLDENMRYWKGTPSDRNKGTNYGDRTTLNTSSSSSTRSVMSENKSLPGFFRSISLRNLLQSEFLSSNNQHTRHNYAFFFADVGISEHFLEGYY